MILDRDFDAPLPGVKITILETEQTVESTDEGNYLISDVAAGAYTLVFHKDGYNRVVKADVVVVSGMLRDLDISLSGEFTQMEEFIVQDIQFGGGTEAALLDLRMESPVLLDSISADLMSRAGASDAAGALNLVTGATVQDGKYATIRGLPDRYVNSQINSVRLPTADADKRAVQLDQFPADIIESIQVSKTFTPDQQGDASGGAVNLITRSIPEQFSLSIGGEYTYNTSVRDSDGSFLDYDESGFDFFGSSEQDRAIEPLGTDWNGAVGPRENSAPQDYKFSVSGGGSWNLDEDFRIGAFGSMYYKRESFFTDDKIDDKYWVENPGDGMSPQYNDGTPRQGKFKTSLYDIAQSRESLKWSSLGALGIEYEDHTLGFMYMKTKVVDDVRTLAEDTRGKQHYFPGYDYNRPGDVNPDEAPYLRSETLEYTERTTETIQFNGTHRLFDPDWEIGDMLSFSNPELDWTFAVSGAELDQPDKRQFGSVWYPASPETLNPGFPPWIPPYTIPGKPAEFRQLKADGGARLGNLQRIWKNIQEDSDQLFINLKMPFTQWSDNEGYFKFGFFNDELTREYTQDSFSNLNDPNNSFAGDWNDSWSEVFPDEYHEMQDPLIDVNYDGSQKIRAFYYMVDMPLDSKLNLIGGLRHEYTDLSTIIEPEANATWIPPGSAGSVIINPGDADVFFSQDDTLPSIGFEYDLFEEVKIRGSYSETVARQTFKELTPVKQQDYLGGDVFVGNPELTMSALENYDLRCDFTPYEGSLISASYFFKDVTDPIEYVQRNAGITYTTAVNYPEGEISGWEFEIRQELGNFWEDLAGLTAGANATFISSEVTLPDDEADDFDEPNIQAPTRKRDMTNAPEHLYNLFLTYDLDHIGFEDTNVGLFYTVRGDTLAAGAGQSNGNYIPDVYEKQFGTLNFTLSHKLNKNMKLKFQAKNLLDPEIDTVYRSDYIDGDVTKSSYTKGMAFSVSVTANF
ncbi:TonB-dependent receptor domain-containing protein [Limihaloglobus sulfuriphilus]|nr:TonB-dependent receptor [Limihaloglobus sulfuriphilus]